MADAEFEKNFQHRATIKALYIFLLHGWASGLICVRNANDMQEAAGVLLREVIYVKFPKSCSLSDDGAGRECCSSAVKLEGFR